MFSNDMILCIDCKPIAKFVVIVVYKPLGDSLLSPQYAIQKVYSVLLHPLIVGTFSNI